MPIVAQAVMDNVMAMAATSRVTGLSLRRDFTLRERRTWVEIPNGVAG